MSDKTHSPVFAHLIRFNRGLAINPNIKFSNKRLNEIVQREEEIFNELKKLDNEILKIAQDYAKENNIELSS